MARTDLLDELRRRTLLCDGAMGTQLMAAGLAPGACGELWNTERPDRIAAIHRAYRQAGCELITTNTFGGCSAALGRHGAADAVGDVNRAAAQLARQAIDADPARPGWVLGDLGPFGGFLEPAGDMRADELFGIFVQQIEALVEGGADALIIETMVDTAELALAVRAARRVAKLPVLATYAFNRAADAAGFRTIMGADVAEAVRQALDAGADVVGANCGTSLSLEDYQQLAQALMAAAGGKPVIVQPNAGAPQLRDGQLVHPATPADMAGMAQRMLELGVRVIGGCCGTTPAHLAAMAQALGR